MNDRERARRFANELSQTGWAFWATEAGEERVAAELAAVRAEERAKLETLAKDAAASAIRATATLLATMERAERLAEAVRRASAEIRHVYRAAFLAGSDVNRHDDGLLSYAVKTLETALAAWDEDR